MPKILESIKNSVNNIFGTEPAQEQVDMTTEEMAFLTHIENCQTTAESTSRTDLETVWNDEYLIYKGGGSQWDTSFAHRTRATKKIRPNAENNFVFNSIQNILANITASTPEVTMEGEEIHQEITDKVTYMSRFNDQRNKFKATWKKMVLDFVAYGPVIGAVVWDNSWMGGTGPDRWVGDVRIIRIDKKEFYPDPAIIDLETRLQECSFINRKFRKKLQWIRDTWENGKGVGSENNTDDEQDEGSDPQQAYLVEHWHKGKPQYMTPKRRKELLEQADLFEQDGDTYKAQDYRDMAKGIMDGIHLAYQANGVFLEYIPYVYDDGLYPFVYKSCYPDDNSQFGWGEIRNTKIPQVMYNKMDEIEIDAITRQGLSGSYYNKGAISPKQLDNIMQNSSKNGAMFEVDDLNRIREREPVKVPPNIQQFKDTHERIIQTVSQVTPTAMGQQEYAGMPARSVMELGARADVRTKGKTEILEDFLIEINKLRINRFAQFYTEDRYYRIKGQNNKVISGTLNKSEMFLEWIREDAQIDPNTEQPIPGTEKRERFVPDFDISVRIMDEKPQDRNYYTQTAVSLYTLPTPAMTYEHLWYTLDEGKFPPKEQVISDLKARDAAIAQAQQQKIQQETQFKQQELDTKKPPEEPPKEQVDPDEFIQSLEQHFPEMMDKISQLDPQQQTALISRLMELEPDALEAELLKMDEQLRKVEEKNAAEKGKKQKSNK